MEYSTQRNTTKYYHISPQKQRAEVGTPKQVMLRIRLGEGEEGGAQLENGQGSKDQISKPNEPLS